MVSPRLAPALLYHRRNLRRGLNFAVTTITWIEFSAKFGILALSETFKNAPRISFVSLGCPKALVDSERILTRLRAEGYELSKSHHGADEVIVNTCGFLDSAKAESLAAIRAGMEENGKVIVTGCLGAKQELVREAHPKVLAITGMDSVKYCRASVFVLAITLVQLGILCQYTDFQDACQSEF